MRERREWQEAWAEREDETSARRILLAEDDAAMRGLLARRLRRAGFEVIEARGGHDALERLAHAVVSWPTLGFDLVISDVRMPGYDGLNLLASLKQLPAHIPVVLITAFGTAAAHAAAERLGAFAMLDKPFDLDDLMAVVHSALQPITGPEGEG